MSPGPELILESAAENNGPVSYIYRALKVLEILAVSEATSEQVAKALEVHKRTAQRLIETMIAAGFVIPDRTNSQRYTLTTKIIAIGGLFHSRNSLFRIAYPYVCRLRDLTSESVNFAIPAHGKHIVIIHERGLHVLRGGPEVGSPGPAHASSLGKSLLAFLPEEFEAVCRIGLKRFTPHTIVSREELSVHLCQVRAQGYAVDNEEQEVGLRCVGAPVWDYSGQVVAAISVAGPSQRINSETIPHLANHVVAIAQELSHDLGYNEFLRLHEQLEKDNAPVSGSGKPVQEHM